MKKHAFALMAFSAAIAFSAPAAAQTINGAPAIASYHSQGRCLDMRASDKQVLLWNCHGGSNQAFRFVSGNYGMVSLGDQRCLTSGLTSGAPITVQTCTNAANQKWGYQSNGTLRNESGFCLDIEGGATGDGARILGYTCHGGGNQQWYPAVTSSSASLGTAAQLKLQGKGSAKSVISSPNFSGGNIVASGGGNIVAGGAGNMIASGGGKIVAGGAGNMIAKFGGQLIANDGASIVAGGAGNMVPGNWSFFSGSGAGVIAAGAGN